MAEKVDLCTQRLDRAHKLIGGLGDEKDRWGETVTQFDKLLVNVNRGCEKDTLWASSSAAYPLHSVLPVPVGPTHITGFLSNISIK